MTATNVNYNILNTLRLSGLVRKGLRYQHKISLNIIYLILFKKCIILNTFMKNIFVYGSKTNVLAVVCGVTKIVCTKMQLLLPNIGVVRNTTAILALNPHRLFIAWQIIFLQNNNLFRIMILLKECNNMFRIFRTVQIGLLLTQTPQQAGDNGVSELRN